MWLCCCSSTFLTFFVRGPRFRKLPRIIKAFLSKRPLVPDRSRRGLAILPDDSTGVGCGLQDETGISTRDYYGFRWKEG